MSTTAEASSPGDTARWFTPGLIAITVAALAGRFYYLVQSKVNDTASIFQGDAFWYSTTAQNLARGEFFLSAFTGNPTADHPPLTVVVLAPASLLFRDSTYAQRLTMVLLGAATVAVIGLAARRLAGPRAGLIAAGVAALAPALWVSDVLLMSETPAALLIALILWAGIALADNQERRLVVVAGVLCGLATLARAEMGLFLPLMVWPILVLNRGQTWQHRARLVGLATAATVAVIAPWTVLNLTRFQEPVLLSNNDGVTLLGANCRSTYEGAITGGWVIEPCLTDLYTTIDDHKPPRTAAQRDEQRRAAAVNPAVKLCDDPFQKRLPCWDASKVSKLMRAKGLRYITHHKADLPRVILARNGRVWGFYQPGRGASAGLAEGRERWVSQWGFFQTWALLPVSAAGAVVLRKRRVSLIPFAASVLIVVVVSSAFYGLVRFRLPYDVASCLLAGVAFSALFGSDENAGRSSSRWPWTPQ